MPSVAESPTCMGKKRRRDDDAVDVQMKLSSPNLHRHLIHDNIPSALSDHRNRNDSSLPIAELHLRTIFPKPRRHDSKRQRIEPRHEHENNDDAFRAYNRDQDGRNGWEVEEWLGHNNIQRKENKVDLSPCHICRRKPTAKHELDAFADCERCRNRTCWICIRECLGLGITRKENNEPNISPVAMADEKNGSAWYNQAREIVNQPESPQNMYARADLKSTGLRALEHKGRICSRCCEERGTEGEVWCLGCLGATGTASTRAGSI